MFYKNKFTWVNQCIYLEFITLFLLKACYNKIVLLSPCVSILRKKKVSIQSFQYLLRRTFLFGERERDDSINNHHFHSYVSSDAKAQRKKKRKIEKNIYCNERTSKRNDVGNETNEIYIHRLAAPRRRSIAVVLGTGYIIQPNHSSIH